MRNQKMYLSKNFNLWGIHVIKIFRISDLRNPTWKRTQCLETNRHDLGNIKQCERLSESSKSRCPFMKWPQTTINKPLICQIICLGKHPVPTYRIQGETLGKLKRYCWKKYKMYVLPSSIVETPLIWQNLKKRLNAFH